MNRFSPSPRNHLEYSLYIAREYSIVEAVKYNLQVMRDKSESLVDNVQALGVITLVNMYEFTEKIFSKSR